MANESFAEFAETLQREIEQETGVKFGVLQLSMFVGQTYTEEIVQQKNVDEADAEALISFMKNHGYVTEDGKPTELAKAAVVEHTTQLPPQMEEIKERIAQAIKQDTVVKPEALIGAPYTEKVTVEKTIDYEDAAALMNHLEEKKLITKDGKIKDTMKAQLAAGTLDLSARFSQAAQKAIIRAIKKPIPGRRSAMLPARGNGAP